MLGGRTDKDFWDGKWDDWGERESRRGERRGTKLSRSRAKKQVSGGHDDGKIWGKRDLQTDGRPERGREKSRAAKRQRDCRFPQF